jgi:uncharacterized protein
MTFLQAEWRKLALANYCIEPVLLQPFVPFGTELDLWNDQCYLSLVGFMFINTRVLGVRIPWHTNFEEVNLRFYVKRKVDGQWRRGVVFIKEIVPRHAITFVANTLYHEHYHTMPMRHQWTNAGSELTIDYSWKFQKQWNSLKLTTKAQPIEIAMGSEAEFITEHYFGYNLVGPSRTTEYEVHHPRWEQYEVLSHQVDVDFEQLYGKPFGELNGIEPVSVMLAEGSAIEVMGKMDLSSKG